VENVKEILKNCIDFLDDKTEEVINLGSSNTQSVMKQVAVFYEVSLKLESALESLNKKKAEKVLITEFKDSWNVHDPDNISAWREFGTQEKAQKFASIIKRYGWDEACEVFYTWLT